MQKKLIALAVAGLVSSGAMAQVTLYGVADVYLGMFSTDGAASAAVTGRNEDLTATPVVTRREPVAAQSASTAKRTAVNSGLLSGSRIGFKAEEDLGGGMKALALLENAITIDSNSTAGLWGITRQAYVGLDTNAGRFSLGRQYAPGYFAGLASDGFAGAAMGPQSILSLNLGATITPNSGARIENSVNWVSKPMGGVTVNALYAFGEDNNDPADAKPNEGKDKNFMGLGAQGKFGALTVDFAGHSLQTSDNTKQTEKFLGAAYNLGMATLGLSYQTVAAAKKESTLVTVSAIVNAGTGKVHLAYASTSSDDIAANDGQKSIAVAYTHPMGKRTTAYFGYNSTSRDVAGTINTIGVQSNATDASLLAAGLRLTF